MLPPFWGNLFRTRESEATGVQYSSREDAWRFLESTQNPVNHDWSEKEENAEEKAYKYNKTRTQKKEKREEGESVKVSFFLSHYVLWFRELFGAITHEISDVKLYNYLIKLFRYPKDPKVNSPNLLPNPENVILQQERIP